MHTEIPNTSYCYEQSREIDFKELAGRVKTMRREGRLSPVVLDRIRKYFRIKNIYHSNAIEGNLLAVGETRTVVEEGLTITGVPLKDQAEARNLSHALDYLETIVKNDQPIREVDIRQIHKLVLEGISEEAGKYRSKPVEISGSDYKPTNPESIPVAMAELGDYLAKISNPESADLGSLNGLIVASVTHTWFVTIHPFIDGNGRVGRLLLNLILMRYGFPIAIIAKEDRIRYYDALEQSQSSDLTAFISLISECISESLEEYEAAAEEQNTHSQWIENLKNKFSETYGVQVENQYEVWKNAMELLKSYLQGSVKSFNEIDCYGAKFFSKIMVI